MKREEANSRHHYIKTLIERGRLPRPGQGPSEEVRARSWFRLFFWAQAADAAGGAAASGGGGGTRAVLTSVAGGDPGYDETSKMVSEAAALLATRREELPATRTRRAGAAPGCGGVLTPAFAFGGALVDALHSRGLTFTEHALVGGAGGLSVQEAAQRLRALAEQPRDA